MTNQRRENGVPGSEDYAGDVSPEEAWHALTNDKAAALVDVRTQPEWVFVGIPNLQEAGKQPLLVQWQVFPSMQINPGLVDQLREAGLKPNHPIYFLCRSGARSRSAAIAMTQAGYSQCFNIAGGFEGGHDAERHRGRKEGWKAAGLPWQQD
jgi:rhodanese-related sulfurtransferase